jgi:hypothetical protein
METRSEVRLFHMLAACVLGACLLGVSAHAKLYIFGQVTGDDLDLCPEAFTMEVADVLGEDQAPQALFTFTNNCDSDGVLGRIFFMKNDLMTFNGIDDQSDGVAFSQPNGKNAMLPGGHPLGFTPHNTFSINAAPPRPHNGLHFEEYVSILFDLTGETSFDDIIEEIDVQSLGVGIHTQALPGGGSASFTATAIPEPLTLSLLGLGTLLIRNKRRGTAQ